MRNSSLGAAQWLHQYLVPELTAVLAVIAQQHATGLALCDGGAQLIATLLVTIPGLQLAQIMAYQLLGAITGHALKRRVGVDHRLLIRRCFADDDALRGRVEYPAQKF